MCHACPLVTDLQGSRGILSFGGALILASIVSKTLIYLMIGT